MSRTRTLKMYI